LSEGLVWPPRREDLERLYLVDKLSAAKIAEVYGLKYKNPKVAESTVLYQLKKNGIKRRDPAGHVRKVTDSMVDEWVKRYESGDSLKQIAAEDVDPVTVWNHLKARGLVLRDKVEAQIQAVTKYERKPFSGDKIERAYLMGLRYGDLNAVKHGRSIRVRVSTTHPAMADLFESLFEPYGHVARYPREAKLVNFEWTLETDLDKSFEFLLSKPSISQLEALSPTEVIAFLAGFFDAEGSIYLHEKRGRFNPEVSFSGTEEKLMDYVGRAVKDMGLHCKLDWVIQNENRDGIAGYSREGRVALWRFHDVQEFLRILPIRHAEKIGKARLVKEMEYRSDVSKNIEIRRAWEKLASEFKADRQAFIDLARRSLVLSDVHRTLSTGSCLRR
jgi:LAGLIDADG-like domain